jgi:hypothetical protein
MMCVPLSGRSLKKEIAYSNWFKQICFWVNDVKKISKKPIFYA